MPLEGEEFIDRVESCNLTLTTHRIRQGTERDFTSIMLEQVCSIAVHRVAKPWLLVVGFAAIVGAVISLEYQRIDVVSGGTVALVGLVLVLLHFLTRFRVVEIASARASIFVRLPRRKPEPVLRLIDAIELAKSERMRVLSESR